MRKLVVLACLSCLVALPKLAEAADTSSRYLQLNSDVGVYSSENTQIIGTNITLTQPSWVYLQSDGRWYPSGGTIAAMSIAINGTRIPNAAVIDWYNTSNAQQHSYNVVGATYLEAGTYSFDLVGFVILGPGFVVGAGSNLSILVNPAQSVSMVYVDPDTGYLSFDLTEFYNNNAPLPTTQLLASAVTTNGTDPIIAMVSARAYKAYDGDPLLGIYLDGEYRGNDEASWLTNDLCVCAETQAPLYGHAFFTPVSEGSHTVSLEASKWPWVGNPSVYVVGSGTTLVTLAGGMVVKGSAFNSSTQFGIGEYLGVGRGPASVFPECGGPGDTPCVGTDVLVAEGTVEIPTGHNGVVFFSAKANIQGDPMDGGGTISLFITIDNSFIGSWGLQQLRYPSGSSQRGLTASYLADGEHALSEGTHTVRVYMRADLEETWSNPVSSFRWVSATTYLPLLWFD